MRKSCCGGRRTCQRRHGTRMPRSHLLHMVLLMGQHIPPVISTDRLRCCLRDACIGMAEGCQRTYGIAFLECLKARDNMFKSILRPRISSFSQISKRREYIPRYVKVQIGFSKIGKNISVYSPEFSTLQTGDLHHRRRWLSHYCLFLQLATHHNILSQRLPFHILKFHRRLRSAGMVMNRSRRDTNSPFT